MVKGRKGAIQQMQALIVPLVGIGVVLAIGFLILAQVKDQAIQVNPCMTNTGLNAWVYNSSTLDCGNYSANNATRGSVSYAVNGTSTIQVALSDIPGWLPIIIITVIGAILIGLVSIFGRRR